MMGLLFIRDLKTFKTSTSSVSLNRNSLSVLISPIIRLVESILLIVVSNENTLANIVSHHLDRLKRIS